MYLPSSLCQGSQRTAGREMVHLVSTHCVPSAVPGTLLGWPHLVLSEGPRHQPEARWRAPSQRNLWKAWSEMVGAL